MKRPLTKAQKEHDKRVQENTETFTLAHVGFKVLAPASQTDEESEKDIDAIEDMHDKLFEAFKNMVRETHPHLIVRKLDR